MPLTLNLISAFEFEIIHVEIWLSHMACELPQTNARRRGESLNFQVMI